MITKVKYIICAFCIVCGSFSCSDMLETESSRQNIDPEINEKTDSAFYAFGILQAMQQVADQYVLQGEMRGDLLKTTLYTDSMLTQLASFTATTTNKYDSAYVYYRIINNCNYYIAHCDTTLSTGSTNVVMNLYAATKAIRAWAYLQLGRNYERVPFFTYPLTQISQINDAIPELTLSQIVAELAPDLEQYTGYQVPTLGYSANQVSVGSPNWESTQKQFSPARCFIPVDVVLGDMYLEVGSYSDAARHYVTYFTRVASQDDRTNLYQSSMVSKTSMSTGNRPGGAAELSELPSPSDFSSMNVYNAYVSATPSWSNIFSRNTVEDIVSYIPMASNSQNGPTTQLPLIFGFDYYATPDEVQRNGEPYIDEIQLLPSDALNLLSDSTEFYYYAGYTGQNDLYDSIRISTAGDMRLRSILHKEQEDDSLMLWIDKYKYATIVLYRNSTIWLRLAEAFNRLGMSDVAFCILKDGISENVLATVGGGYQMAYITEDSRQSLTTTYPLLSTANLSLFPSTDISGIHTHGAGRASSNLANMSGNGGNIYHTNKGESPFNLDRIVGKKLQEIASTFGAAVGTTKQDTINAIEDLICDELALEAAFEGNRFYDLARMARHKNQDGLYGANFGGQWFARKLAANVRQSGVDLTNEKNWYLKLK